MDKCYKEFSVNIYGQWERYNDTMSKARCRIFYKYENRNGTYITDEYAEKLLSSLPYAPVKGIYSEDDFGSHGARTDGRIYAIVPENPNIAWEDHLDEDGVTRTYACADVLIYTALYKEANEIVGKSQSMELYEPSIKYHYAMIHGQRYVVFDEGCFLGLQVLGDTVEPCFEGAGFFNLMKKIEEVSDTYSEVGGKEMPKLNFKLSDDEKFQAIWTLLNTDFSEENDWTITYGISAIYDDYALAVNYETGAYERVYYKKNDENDMVELLDRQTVYIVDVTESEKETLNTLRTLNGDTYELVNENLVNAEANATAVAEAEQRNSEYSAKIEELESTISTLNIEIQGNATQYEAASAEKDASIEQLTEELTALKQYKYETEKAQKESVINQYSDQLSESVLDSYREKMDSFTAEDLDKELTYELKKVNPSIFSKNNPINEYMPKDSQLSGLDAILAKYVK